MNEPEPPESRQPTLRRLAIPPWIQLVGLPLLIIFGWLFAVAAGHAVMLFLVAGIISLLLAPMVRGLITIRLPRTISVLVVYTCFALVITVASISLVNESVSQISHLQEDLPTYIESAESGIGDVQAFLDRRGVDINLENEVDSFLRQFEDSSAAAISRTVRVGSNFVGSIVEVLFNIVLVVVISIYMLFDAPRIGRLLTSPFPPDSNVEALFTRVEGALIDYVRGQTLVSVVMGGSAAIGLYLFGVTGIWEQAAELALIFGLIVAVTELIPYVGPVLGAIPPTVFALFDSPVTALAVAIFFLALHQIEGHIVIPKLMGNAVGVHPLVIIFALLAGSQIVGPLGAILVLPLVAAGREIVLFVSERVELERWYNPGTVAVFDPGPTPGSPPRTRGHKQDSSATAARAAAAASRAREIFRWRRRGE